MTTNGAVDLGAVVSEAARKHGGSMGDYSVLAPGNDPYRQDTPTRRLHAEWLAETIDRLGVYRRRAAIHCRGLHYVLLDQPLPDGTPYVNTHKQWKALVEWAGAARWLGIIPFDQIVDERSDPPAVRAATRRSRGDPYISAGVAVTVDAEFEPAVGRYGDTVAQSHRIVLWGEKSSLADTLQPIADTYGADLYLGTGEVSITFTHDMAKVAVADGRPMIVLVLADCDPAGWQMAISLGRKLQALRDGWYPDLDYEVRRIALTPDQVREHGLPSTPLKPGEERGDAWTAAMGVEQTEIDALGTLRPDLLRTIVRDAIRPFYDSTLDQRMWGAYAEWKATAQAIVDESLDDERLARIRAEAQAKLGELRAEIAALNRQLRINVDDFDLPRFELPEAAAPGTNAEALLSSEWDYATATGALKASKRYER